MKLPIDHNPLKPTNHDYLMGQIVAELRALNQKVDELGVKFEKMEKAVDGLIAWRNEHMQMHADDEKNIKMSKSTFWALITAIIASGLLFRLLGW